MSDYLSDNRALAPEVERALLATSDPVDSIPLSVATRRVEGSEDPGLVEVEGAQGYLLAVQSVAEVKFLMGAGWRPDLNGCP
jgi:hypothetical protein